MAATFILIAHFNIGSFLAGGLTGGLLLAMAVAYWSRWRFQLQVHQLERQVRDLSPGTESKKVGMQVGIPAVFRGVVNLLAKTKSDFHEKIAEARDSGERTNAVLNKMVEGVMVIDDQFRVIFANQASANLLSVQQKSLKNRSILELVRSPAIESAVCNCLTRRETVETEFEITRDVRRVLSVRLLWMGDQSAASAMLELNDVTNLRQLESMRRDFVANVSHELKTPLASIKAYAETLRMGGIDDQDNRMSFVMTIEDQANRLHQLIIDLIQLSKIEQGKNAFHVTDVELGALVAERVENFRDIANKNQVALDYEFLEDEVWGRVDDEGMQTIVDNLISNAIRYTPPGGSVKVFCRNQGERSVVSVADTGIGIPPDLQERVFERFYRVDKARSREKGGTGLGLSIVKHLVQSFGGTISLESSIGRGSTFSVAIPNDFPAKIPPASDEPTAKLHS